LKWTVLCEEWDGIGDGDGGVDDNQPMMEKNSKLREQCQCYLEKKQSCGFYLTFARIILRFYVERIR